MSSVHYIFYSLIYAFVVRVISMIISFINGSYFEQNSFNAVSFISIIISDIVSGLGICIYCEVIELNFCNFNYNLRRYIVERGEKDFKSEMIEKAEKIDNLLDEENDDENEESNNSIY